MTLYEEVIRTISYFVSKDVTLARLKCNDFVCFSPFDFYVAICWMYCVGRIKVQSNSCGTDVNWSVESITPVIKCDNMCYYSIWPLIVRKTRNSKIEALRKSFSVLSYWRPTFDIHDIVHILLITFLFGQLWCSPYCSLLNSHAANWTAHTSLGI